MNNKPKIQKMKSGEKITAHNLLFMILSLVLTFALFLGLIFVQNYLSEEITYQTVIVAKKEIPANTILNMENAQEFLGTKMINTLDTSSDNLQTVDTLIGMRNKVRLVKGEPVMLKDFEDVVSYVDQFENPVEMSIAAPDASDADGGKLRAGDMINITLRYSKKQIVDKEYETGTTNTENGMSWFQAYEVTTDESDASEDQFVQTEDVQDEVPATISTIRASSKAYNFENQYAYLLEGVYIHKVLDADGKEIAPSDTEATADILVLIVDRSAEIELNEMLENGASMRISKILDKEKYLEMMEKEAAEKMKADKEAKAQEKITPPVPVTTPVPEDLTQAEEVTEETESSKNLDETDNTGE